MCLFKALESLCVAEVAGVYCYGCSFGARLDHLSERILLELGSAFDDRDQIRHQIRASLILVLHLAPGRFYILVERLEAVITAACQ